MANYSISNSTAIGSGNVQQAIATTYKSLVVIGNSSATTATNGYAGPRRQKIYDIILGNNGTPSDNYLEYDGVLITLGTTPAGITGTLVSAVSSNFLLDQADTVLQAAIQINSTGEVGITAVTEKWYLGINQRAAYRWVCQPGSEIFVPANSSATSPNGFALRCRSPVFTGNATATVMGSEQ
jgi:hypothetical protein